MTLASIADGFRTRKRMDYVVRTAGSLDADVVIYFYNLNDTLPDVIAYSEDRLIQTRQSGLLPTLIDLVREHTEFLRSQSYLYNWVRFKVRVALLRFGIEYHGEEAYELFPDRNQQVIAETATRIAYLHEMLAEQEIDFLVVILPYEMQVSAAAARTYASMGIRWGDNFIDRRLQQLLTRSLRPNVKVLDAYSAFVENASDRDHIDVGELFVYNKGDSLDWNHPNRKGHKLIAEFLETNSLFLDVIEGR